MMESEFRINSQSLTIQGLIILLLESLTYLISKIVFLSCTSWLIKTSMWIQYLLFINKWPRIQFWICSVVHTAHIWTGSDSAPWSLLPQLLYACVKPLTQTTGISKTKLINCSWHLKHVSLLVCCDTLRCFQRGFNFIPPPLVLVNCHWTYLCSRSVTNI